MTVKLKPKQTIIALDVSSLEEIKDLLNEARESVSEEDEDFDYDEEDEDIDEEEEN